MVNKIYGNYMGYADFDDERYWDLRHQDNYEITDLPLNNVDIKCLSSDARNRKDIQELKNNNIEVAQENKNTLE